MSYASYSSPYVEGGEYSVVHPGACYLNNELVRCALDEIHCDGLEFRSSRQLLDIDDPATDRCKRPHPEFIGMCASGIDNYHCTGHSSGCTISAKFVPNFPYCSVQYNHFPDRDSHLAVYPTCTTESGHTCVWSLDDCEGAGETYTAASYANELCTCDKVQTGACVKDDDWTCAVSADACDPHSTFVSWKKVLAQGKNCRLCLDFDKDPSNAKTGKVWFTERMNPNGSSGSRPSENRPWGSSSSSSSSNNNSLQADDSCQSAFVATSVVGGTLGALWLALVLHYCCIGRRPPPIVTNENVADRVPEGAVAEDTEEGGVKNGTMA